MLLIVLLEVIGVAVVFDGVAVVFDTTHQNSP